MLPEENYKKNRKTDLGSLRFLQTTFSQLMEKTNHNFLETDHDLIMVANQTYTTILTHVHFQCIHM